jgi:hypothetical protein
VVVRTELTVIGEADVVVTVVVRVWIELNVVGTTIVVRSDVVTRLVRTVVRMLVTVFVATEEVEAVPNRS